MKKGLLLGLALGVCAAMMASTGRSGPLNPPPGPVQPTMRTLDEIYDRLGAGGGSERWQYTNVTNFVSPETFVRLVNGSGKLHAVIASRSGSGVVDLWVRDGLGRQLGPYYFNSGNDKTLRIEFDTAFESAIDIRGGGFDTLTLLYRLDP